jgi:hypothetical protein
MVYEAVLKSQLLHDIIERLANSYECFSNRVAQSVIKIKREYSSQQNVASISTSFITAHIPTDIVDVKLFGIFKISNQNEIQREFFNYFTLVLIFNRM